MKTKVLLLILTILTFIFIHNAKAAETQTFYDNFESGVDNWDLGLKWSVISEGGNKIFC